MLRVSWMVCDSEPSWTVASGDWLQAEHLQGPGSGLKIGFPWVEPNGPSFSHLLHVAMAGINSRAEVWDLLISIRFCLKNRKECVDSMSKMPAEVTVWLLHTYAHARTGENEEIMTCRYWGSQGQKPRRKQSLQEDWLFTEALEIQANVLLLFPGLHGICSAAGRGTSVPAFHVCSAVWAMSHELLLLGLLTLPVQFIGLAKFEPWWT